MQQFVHLTPPTEGAAITRRGGELVVPDAPIVPFIEGDGTGPDIWKASVRVFDAAVAKAFGGKKKIVWFEVPAGEKAKAQYGEWLPNDTIEAVKQYKVAIKGPLTTPVGGGPSAPGSGGSSASGETIAAASLVLGSVSRKTVPLPGCDHTSSEPPWATASSSEMARPSPVPPIVRMRLGSARHCPSDSRTRHRRAGRAAAGPTPRR